ncbi:MAG TPA: glycosyltransferase family 4 protein [Kofleriaceae bacterium]|nr:glycosyltransferase family 4 protein [Kofleriaceae bacterium]
MRLQIAQVAPLHERVPPRRYGGTERIVSYLTEELVRMGHDVTLFASGDSVTAARLIAGCDHSLREAGTMDGLAPHFAEFEEVVRRARQFDVIHFHVDYLHFPISARERYAHLTTLHGRLDLPEIAPVYRAYADMPLVSISDAQRAPLPFARWHATVHHGIPDDLYRLQPERGSYLAFLGRIAPEKRPDWAIEIARRAGYPIRIAAKIDRADRAYYEDQIAPLMRQPHVEYIGEIDDADKQDFLGGALALVFPIDWPEPFGLVMLEAMACGTPVIACRRGSVPEVIDDGVTGFIVDGVDAAVDAVARCATLSRPGCRARFEQRFTARRMAEDYVMAYQTLLEHVRGARTHAAS